MNYPLSNKELYELFDDKCKILRYKDIENIKDLDELFRPFNITFILYEIKDGFGHWVVVCRRSSSVYFFDSYGLFPDDEIQYTGKDYPHWLSAIFMKALEQPKPVKITYNDIPLQDITNPDSATCGRWCALYALLYKDVSMKEFADIFKGLDKDLAVTLLTSFVPDYSVKLE